MCPCSAVGGRLGLLRVGVALGAMATAVASLLAVTPASAATAPLKAPITGLVDRAGAPAKAFSAAVGSYVLNARWADVEPAPGQFVYTSIDRSLAAGTGPVRLRLRAGVDAPEWAKGL